MWLKVNRPLLWVIAVYAIILAVCVPRWADNVWMQAAFDDDGPALCQALDAMTVWPYGNPANFFRDHSRVPPYWYNLRYWGFVYYGGTYLDLAFPVFALLKAFGAPVFPTAPFLLRAVSALAAILSLIVLYNVGRIFSSRLAGAIALAALATDFKFFYWASEIHPDSLQVLIGLLALLAASYHSEKGDRSSLAALAVMVGLFQGTKAGAPWLVPMVLLALYWGTRASLANAPRFPLGAGARRLAVFGAVATASFFLSTPYAFLDSYYWTTMKALHLVVTQEALFYPIGLFEWGRAIVEHNGLFLVVGWGISLAALFYGFFRGNAPRGLVLAAVMSLSGICWFMYNGRLWVRPEYLLASFGLLSVILGHMLSEMMRLVRERWGVWSKRAAQAVIAGCFSVIILGNSYPVMWDALVAINWDKMTTFQLTKWAQSAFSRNDRILFVNDCYLHSELFPNALRLGGMLAYQRLIDFRPDYLILSSRHFDSPMNRFMRATQNNDLLDPRDVSVALEQTLVDQCGPIRIGCSGIPGIRLIKVICDPVFSSFPPPNLHRHEMYSGKSGPTAPAAGKLICSQLGVSEHREGADASSSELVSLLSRIELSVQKSIRSLAALAWLIKLRLGLESGACGYTYLVYRLCWDCEPGPPKAISSGDVIGHPAAYAFDGIPYTTWKSNLVGSEVAGTAFIGFDYGAGNDVSVEKIGFSCGAGSGIPSKIRVQYSNNGSLWRDAAEFAGLCFDSASKANSPQEFQLPYVGSARYWRILADASLPQNTSFAIGELRLTRNQPWRCHNACEE
jgi:hypothetical protein